MKNRIFLLILTVAVLLLSSCGNSNNTPEKDVAKNNEVKELISTFCEKIAIMSDGKIVEQGSTNKIIKKPSNEETKKLITCLL